VAPILLIFLRINEHTGYRPIIGGAKCIVAYPTKILDGPQQRPAVPNATYDYTRPTTTTTTTTAAAAAAAAAVTVVVIMSPLRRHIFVCFMAKSAFWVFFGPSSVKRGRTHTVLG